VVPEMIVKASLAVAMAPPAVVLMMAMLEQLTGMAFPANEMVGWLGSELHSRIVPMELGASPVAVTCTTWPPERQVAGVIVRVALAPVVEFVAVAEAGWPVHELDPEVVVDVVPADPDPKVMGALALSPAASMNITTH
jgi:hypothetical protein